MERKIFNSYESRIKLDSDFEQDCYWLLRSVCNSREFFTGYVDDYGYIDYSTIDIWEQNFIAKTLRTIPLYISLRFAFNMNITDEFYIVDLICYALSSTKSTISSAGFNAENVNIKKELKSNISTIKEIIIEANENSFNTLGISELTLMNTLGNMIGAWYKYQS